MIAIIHRAFVGVPEHLRPLLIQCAVIYTALAMGLAVTLLVRIVETMGASVVLTHNAMFGCTLATCLVPGAARFIWGRR